MENRVICWTDNSKFLMPAFLYYCALCYVRGRSISTSTKFVKTLQQNQLDADKATDKNVAGDIV